jgi:hypothetical protein
MRGERESGGLKKKGSPIGPHWVGTCLSSTTELVEPTLLEEPQHMTIYKGCNMERCFSFVLVMCISVYLCTHRLISVIVFYCNFRIS